MKLFNFLLYSLFFSFLAYTHVLSAESVPLTAYAYSFVTNVPIAGANIKIKDHSRKVIGSGITDDQGLFGPITLQAGQEIFLTIKKDGFHKTQSATLIIPESGFVGNNRIIFQVPDSASFWLLRNIIGGDEKEDHCHVAGTLAEHGKTYEDLPHGEEGAVIFAQHLENKSLYKADFYFDIFSWIEGPLKDKTNPFSWSLKKTTRDGGFLFKNLPSGDYQIKVEKDETSFDSVRFYCRPGNFINLNPPHGPMAKPLYLDQSHF